MRSKQVVEVSPRTGETPVPPPNVVTPTSREGLTRAIGKVAETLGKELWSTVDPNKVAERRQEHHI